MPLPHSATCPCLRCSGRRRDNASIGQLIDASSIGKAVAIMKKAGAWPKALVRQDGFSTTPAPGPKGPSGAEAIAWARQRRADKREKERDER